MNHDMLRDLFADWWSKLTDIKNDGKASLAALRRLGAAEAVFPPEIDVVGAIAISAYRVLHRRVRSLPNLPNDWESQLVVTAVVLAHVREDDTKNKSVAALLGASRIEGDDTTHLMAETRFRCLLRTTDPVELCDQARRAVALLGRKAPVGDLGESLFSWDTRTRRKWAISYWKLDAGPGVAAAPASESPSANGVL
ncbi:MAG: type I-E CRISPR-associated protein Cse2/CasB [Alphaproteobacteria bacterium]|nr:type I-E CRISPR-associated protein Cse2/CasB [Alphaproteobacteria bacterium]